MKNSSCTISTSASCCISRDPPSPDGDHPRPVPLFAKSSRRLSKDHIPTWRTVDTIELREIFEEEVADGAGNCHHVRHKPTIVFREMLEDGHDSDSDKDSVEIKPSKSFNALRAVTRKLKKHMSRGSGPSKQRSRSSLGASEEEIERRAELKRIRHKRIQEELSNEGIYDDDAKSVSFVAVAPTPPSEAKAGHSPWKPGNFVPLPHLTPPALPLPKLSFPHLSPLEKRNDPFSDAILTEGSAAKMVPRRWSDPESSLAFVNSDTLLSRRYSSPYFLEWELKSTEPQVYLPYRKRSSIPPIPPQPVINPLRLASITLPTRPSWRLSFATDNRDDNVRKFSQGTAIPVTLDLNQLRSKSSAPGRGIHRGIRLSSQVILDSEETGNLDTLASHSDTCSASQEYGGVDGVGDGAPAVHLHEMGISQRLASNGLQSSCSSPQLSSWGSHDRGVSNRSSSSQVNAERSRFMRRTTDSTPLSELIPLSWGQVMHSQTSSVYPSGANSTQASREGSRFNLLSLLSGPKSKIEAAEYQKLILSQSSPSLPGTQTANLSSASLAIPPTKYRRHSNVDDNSLLASDTSSFREREAELAVVRARFASAEALKARGPPVSSKFLEEFKIETKEAPVSRQRRSSAFSKLAKFGIRTYDGTKLDEILDVPLPKFDPHELKTTGSHATPGLLSPNPFTPLQDGEAVNLWGKALKKREDESAYDVSDHLLLPQKPSSITSRKKSSREEEPPKSVFTNLTHIGKGTKQRIDLGDHQSAAEEYNQRFQERMAVKEMVLDSWEQEMAATAERAKLRSRNIVQKTKRGPDRRYPATWSRFPCHNRAERSASAGPSNRIDVKDFAVLGQKDDGEIVWCLEHDEEGHHSVITDPNVGKGFRDKIKERIRHKAYKLDTSQRHAALNRGRRGSLSMANEAEYPELEILPFTLLTTAELHAQVEEELKAERESAESPGPVVKISSVDGNSEVDEDDAFVGALRPRNSPVSIADPKFYDDCIVHPEIAHQEYEFQTPTKDWKKDKFRTWNASDFEGYRGGRGRQLSLGSMILKKSTDEHLSEVERMEMDERKKVLKAAEEAWGGYE